MHESKMIYIYADTGVGRDSLIHTMHTFGKIFGKNTLKTIRAKEIIHGTWRSNARLLIMPGGADLPYGNKLNGTGNQVIKEYVAFGGAYLGICAGSYYGSQFVEFDKGGPLEVVGQRELAFFQGKAIGPMFAPFDYNNYWGARAAKVSTICGDLTLFYNGGGFFENAKKLPGVSIIAQYKMEAENLPAIIHIPYGKGNVVLSSPHFEFCQDLLDPDDVHLAKIIPALQNDELLRQNLCLKIMELLGL